MKKMLFILHPFLIAIYPVFSLYAYNVKQLAPGVVIRPWLLTLVGAFVVLLFLRAVVKDWGRAAALTSLILLLFFTYGHVHRLLKVNFGDSAVHLHRYLIALWFLLLACGGWWIIRRLRESRQATRFLNIVASAALILPAYQLSSFLFTRISGRPPVASIQPGATSWTTGRSDGGSLPDVYYIIVDAYARQDVLADYYEYDNAPFVDYLSERGFYVAGQSRSNYMQTLLSLASSLNMDYLDSALEPVDGSLVQHTFEKLGYTTIAFATGYPGTEVQSADFYLSPASKQANALESLSDLGAITPFETMLIQNSATVLLMDAATHCLSEALPQTTADAPAPVKRTSPGCFLVSWLTPYLDYPYKKHRELVQLTLDGLTRLPYTGEPHFVFAHIIAPHYPFVFGPNGELSKQINAFSLSNWNFIGTRETYIQGYVDQVTYLNRRLQSVVDTIMANSITPPIIIIQADHGPDSTTLGEYPGEEAYIIERFSILNAYYLPLGCDSNQLYETITPVNTFRVVLNACFDASFEMLPDRNYTSSYDHPYEFVDVTGLLH